MLNRIINWIIGKEDEGCKITKSLPSPKYVSIEISEKCNLKCHICNQWKESNNLKKLELKDIKKLIDELKKHYPDVVLEFSGPEPLMNRTLLLESLEYAKANNISTALSTNGILLSKENAEALLSLRLKHISVSLDGSNPKTNDYIRNLNGSFQMITEGIRRLVEYKRNNKHVKTEISVTCVITNKNVKELTSIYQLCKKLKIDSINYNAYVLDNSYFLNKEKHLSEDEFWVKKKNIPVLKNQIKQLITLKKSESSPNIATDTKILGRIPDYFELNLGTKEQPCSAGFNYFHITNFGEVTVCGKGPHLNTKKKDIKAIWTSKEFEKTRLQVKNCQKTCLNNCFRLN